MLQLLRESVCMDSKYYTDITDSAPESIKESMNKNPDVIKDNRLNESVSISDSEIKSAICQIKEAKTISDSIVNSVISKLRERGVSLNERKIYRVPIGRWDNVNGNRRKYTRKLWENVMNNQQNAWKGLCGLADHPTESNDPGSIRNSSIVWLGMELDDVEKIVYGIGTFVGIFGHMFQEIIDAGGRVGFSSSGFGEFLSDGQTVNPDTYQIERLADVVLNPSQDVYGEIADEQTGLGNIEYTKQQAVMSESAEPLNNTMRESVMSEEKKSCLSKVEEKAFRNYVTAFIQDTNNMKSPNEQLKELKSINEMFDEGVAPDLKAKLEEKIAAKQAELEALVEQAVSMKEELGVESLDEIKEGTKRVIEEGAELAEQVKNYKNIVEGLTARNKELAEENAKLVETTKKYEEETANLSAAKESLSAAVKDLNLKLTIKEAEELEKTEESAKKESSELAKLSEQIELSAKALREEGLNKVKAEHELSRAKDKIAESEKENKALKESIEKMNIKMQLRDTRAENLAKAHDSELVSTREAIDNANKATAEVKAAAEAKIKVLTERIEKYRNGNDKLEKANARLEAKVKAANSMLSNLSNANKALNESISTIKEAANVEKDKFINAVKESIMKINEAGEVELNIDDNGTLTVKNITKVDVDMGAGAPEVETPASFGSEDAHSLAHDMLDDYAESKNKKSINQLIDFREENGLLIEKYWADQVSRFGEALLPFEHKIRDAKTLAEAQREFFKVLPFISGKINEARINPKAIRQERLEESGTPKMNRTPVQNMAAKFGLK